jgi:hypothetical protein
VGSRIVGAFTPNVAFSDPSMLVVIISRKMHFIAATRQPT